MGHQPLPVRKDCAELSLPSEALEFRVVGRRREENEELRPINRLILIQTVLLALENKLRSNHPTSPQEQLLVGELPRKRMNLPVEE